MNVSSAHVTHLDTPALTQWTGNLIPAMNKGNRTEVAISFPYVAPESRTTGKSTEISHGIPEIKQLQPIEHVNTKAIKPATD